MARLLDWLAWKYKVLFIVSAGNYPQNIEISPQDGVTSPVEMDKPVLREKIMEALAHSGLLRRLKSPAESINSLTVAACHCDTTVSPVSEGIIDPLDSPVLPSPINAQGPGFRRSIKPDILFPGGRQHYRGEPEVDGGKVVLAPSFTSATFGQHVATPSSQAGVVTARRCTCGTSNAAALATRCAAQIHGLLQELRREPGGERLSLEHEAVVLKALLAHGASWNGADRLLPTNDKNLVCRMVGYGVADQSRVMFCTDQRAILLGWGMLSDGEGHQFSLPLPASLSGVKCWRRLTVTLAWLTPVHPSHQAYRKAHLWFVPYGADKDCDCTETLMIGRSEADFKAVRRGTLQHEVFVGEKAAVFAENEEVSIQVNCARDAGKLTDPVPYALAVTLEVAPGIEIPIYDEIVARVRPSVRITPGIESRA